MRIVAFGNQRQVGKNLAAQLLTTNLQIHYPTLRVKSVGFADKLYFVCSDLFGFPSKSFYEANPQEKERECIFNTDLSVRRVLELVGTYMREIDPEVWIKRVIPKEELDILFITDLRFDNEANYLRDNFDTLLVHIIRKTGLPPCTSDIGISDYTGWLEIENNGTKREYNDLLMQELFKELTKNVL